MHGAYRIATVPNDIGEEEMKLPFTTELGNERGPSHQPHRSGSPDHGDLVYLTAAWCSRTRAVERAHFRRSVRFRAIATAVGGTTILLSSLLGVLVHLHVDSHDNSAHTVELVLSVIVPILTALVAFLKFEERSALHHTAAAKFAALKRKLQIHHSQCISYGCSADHVMALREVCKLWDDLTIHSPPLYKSDWPEIASYDKYLMDLRPDEHMPSVSRHTDLSSSPTLHIAPVEHPDGQQPTLRPVVSGSA